LCLLERSNKVKLLRLALSKGHNSYYVSLPSPEEGNIQFPKRCMDNILKLSDFECRVGQYLSVRAKLRANPEEGVTAVKFLARKEAQVYPG
jgi:hypothetical protein